MFNILNEAQKIQLASKRLHLQMLLQARRHIQSGIQFHWLDYFHTIKQLGMQYHIESLCHVTPAEQPFYIEAIKELNNPELNPDMITTSGEDILDKVLKDHPSTSAFKYVMGLPLLDTWNSNVGDMLGKAQELFQFEDGPVYFLSDDCSPVLQLQWNELTRHADEIFDDSCISLIFTDKEYSWIIFRSIELEWRCGRVIKNK